MTTYIDPPRLCPLWQMKILATAVFSVLLLGRSFHSRKWRALVLMVLGVTLVSTSSHKPGGDDDHKTINMQFVFGVLAALLQVWRIHECKWFDGFVQVTVTWAARWFWCWCWCMVLHFISDCHLFLGTCRRSLTLPHSSPLLCYNRYNKLCPEGLILSYPVPNFATNRSRSCAVLFHTLKMYRPLPMSQ